MVEAGRGHRGEPCCKTPVDEHLQKEQRGAGGVRNQNEAMNKRCKHFGCMKQVFRHGIAKHAVFFRAIAVIVQLSLELNRFLKWMTDYNTMNL